MLTRSLFPYSLLRAVSITPKSSSRIAQFQTARFLSTSSKLQAMAAFSHLIRFEAEDGKTYYGDLTKETPTKEIQGKEVELLKGDIQTGFSKSGSKATVSKLLCPLPTTNIILCVGLNYRQHAEECNVSAPEATHQVCTLPNNSSSPSPPTQPSS